MLAHEANGMTDERTETAAPPDMGAFNRALIEEFRASGGRVGGPLAGRPLVLLTTTGAGSGEPRTTPLGYVEDGSPDRIVLFASNLGAPAAPAWFHNLLANPEVVVEVGDHRFPARASVPGGAERDRLYEAFVSRFPGTAEHQARAGRQIPMVLLEPEQLTPAEAPRPASPRSPGGRGRP